MADFRAISAVTTTIADMLRERYAGSGLGGSLNVEAYQPKDFHDPMKDGIALFLWRVTPNTGRRNPGPRIDALGRRFKPSFPVDLSYLIVPFADKADRQQRLFGWMLRAIEDFGPLLATRLNNALADSDLFAQPEGLELVNEPLSIPDQLTLWDRIKTMPACANYVTRLLLLDSNVPIDENPVVVERAFDMGVVG